jgi:hypothetical protein
MKVKVRNIYLYDTHSGYYVDVKLSGFFSFWNPYLIAYELFGRAYIHRNTYESFTKAKNDADRIFKMGEAEYKKEIKAEWQRYRELDKKCRKLEREKTKEYNLK